MDKEFYYNTAIPTWQLLPPAMEIQPHQLNCLSEQSPDSYLNPNWKKSTEQSIHFDSSPSSMVLSPAASHDIFLLRELIGSLVNTGGDPGEISTAAMSAASYMSGNDSTNTSCYNNPMNSPPKLNSSPVMDHLAMQKLSSMENSLALNSSLIELSGDPGNAERAARFSCLGSRSFNGRTRQSEYLLNNNGEFARVASSPSLKALESKSPVQDVAETEMRSISGLDLDRKFAKTLEESPVSEQIPGGESGLKSSNAMNSRKRKAVSRGKAKELAISQSAKSTKVAEGEDDSNPKRRKMIQCHENGTDIEEEQKGNTNTAEPPKDYIHVRARRGQATDSHSLAERVRREKIGERMKLLQDLVPGCNKVTGKALMLDEIINYVRSLQRQVEFLSMKLASVDFRTDLSIERHLSKDHQLYDHQTAHRPILRCNISNETALCRNFSMQLPPLDGFNQGMAQFPALCEDDLQSLVGLARI